MRLWYWRADGLIPTPLPNGKKVAPLGPRSCDGAFDTTLNWGIGGELARHKGRTSEAEGAIVVHMKVVQFFFHRPKGVDEQSEDLVILKNNGDTFWCSVGAVGAAGSAPLWMRFGSCRC